MCRDRRPYPLSRVARLVCYVFPLCYANPDPRSVPPQNSLFFFTSAKHPTQAFCSAIVLTRFLTIPIFTSVTLTRSPAFLLFQQLRLFSPSVASACPTGRPPFPGGACCSHCKRIFRLSNPNCPHSSFPFHLFSWKKLILNLAESLKALPFSCTRMDLLFCILLQQGTRAKY